MIEIVYITNIYYFQPKWLRKKYKYTVKYLFGNLDLYKCKMWIGTKLKESNYGFWFLILQKKTLQIKTHVHDIVMNIKYLDSKTSALKN